MSNGILVICEHDGGTFKKTAFELLAKAKALGVGSVTALVIGADGGAELGGYGADKVVTIAGDFSRHLTGAYVKAVQGAIEAVAPAVVLASASAEAKDALPRLAARLGLGLGTEVTELRNEGGAVVGRRPVYAGKAFVDVAVSSSPALFTVRANSFGVPESNGGSAAVEALGVSVGAGDALTSVVDTEALVDALQHGRLAGAGLDVFDDEPHVPDSLKTLNNVVLTPHVAGLSPEASRGTVQRVVDNLLAFYAGKPVLTPVHS